jgi:hypothetical protein
MAKQFAIVIKALDKTKRGFGSATRGIKSVAGAVLSLKTAIVGAVGVGGIGLLVASSMRATDSLGKTARKIGATTRALAQMRYAADLTGVATATMDMALQRFTRRVAEAANGTGEAKDALRELNLNARKLVQLPLDQQMFQLADAFSEVETDADKVRLAMKLFDSEGVALVNTLGIGKQALMEMAAEADSLGVALSGDAVQGVENANDAFTRLGTLFKGLRDQTVAALAPALNQLATTLKDKVLTAIQETDGGVEVFAGNLAIKVLTAVQSVLSALQTLTNGVIGTINTMNQTVAKFTGIFKDNDEKNAAQLVNRLEKINELLEDRNKKAANPRGQAAHDRNIANLDAEKQQVLQLIAARKQSGDISIIPETEFADEINAFIQTLIDKQEALNQKKREGQAGGGEDGNGDPVAAEQEKLTSIQELNAYHNDLLDQGKKARVAFDKKGTKEQTQIVLGGLQDQLAGSGKISKKLGRLQKTAAIAKATIATYEAATKAFAAGGGFPLGIPMAALSIAQGMAQVAAIKAQSFDGGGFTGVGTRTGGIDGKGGFPAILHPNETVVDHTKPKKLDQTLISTKQVKEKIGSKADLQRMVNNLPTFEGGGYTGGEMSIPSPVVVNNIQQDKQPEDNSKNTKEQPVVVNQNINVTTGVQSTVRSEIANLMPEIRQAAIDAVLGARMRGGSYSKSLLGR